MGEQKNIVAVYDKNSRTPFSGVVPAYLASQLGRIEGVSACSPEVITPVTIHGQTLFIRGVLSAEFLKLTSTVMVAGDFLGNNDFGSIVLGEKAAHRLNVNVNQSVLVFATLADRYVELQIKGVFLTQTSMDDEAFVILDVGQWLRFNDYNRVTLIRAQIDPDAVNSQEIYQELSRNVSSQTTPLPSSQNAAFQRLIPWSNINFPIANLGIGSTQDIMSNYLDSYGVTKQSILVLSILVFCLSSALVVVASRTFALQNSDALMIVHSLGLSKKILRRNLLYKLLSVSVAAAFIGLFLSSIFLALLERLGNLQVLCHSVVFAFDPVIALLNLTLIFVLVTLSVRFTSLD